MEATVLQRRIMMGFVAKRDMRYLVLLALLCSVLSSGYTHSACPSNCSERFYKSITTTNGEQLTWIDRTDDEKFSHFTHLKGCSKATPNDLYVKQPHPLSFLPQPAYYTNVNGSNVMLHCTVTPTPTQYRYNGSYPSLSWFKDDSELSNNLSTLSVSSNGTYYCKFNDGVYSIRSAPMTVAFYQSSDAPSTAAPVRFSDELYNTPFSSSFYSIQKANFFQTVTINLRRGGSAFLDCTPQGHISPPFWSASDNHCWSIPGNDFVKVCDYHLTSLPYCQYILGHTTIARGFKFLNATISSSSRPVFVVTPRPQTVSAGTNVTLYCLINGSSTGSVIRYAWYKNNEATPLEAAAPPVPEVLIIEDIEESANYTCTVTTDGVTLSSTAHVNVIGKPVVDIKWSVEESEAGHIVSTPIPNDIGIIGNVTPNITLFCQVSSSSVSQSFSIFWYFRGQPVLRNSSFPRLLNDSTLFLSNSNGSMGSFLGSVQCLVRGEYHWGSSHVRIVIGNKPNPPGRISITHERSNGIFNRNNTYRISWEPPNSELENSTKQEYSLIMLTEVQKGSQCYVKDKEYFVYELRTNSTSVLYDRLCDFIMLDSNQRFFVAAVGQGGDYKEYSISDYVYSDSLPEIDGSSCFIPINFAADYYLGYPDPLVLANMSSTVTPLGHGFNVSLCTASLQDSYSYYYKPYNIDDLLATHYAYQFNYFCDGENGSFSKSIEDLHSFEGVVQKNFHLGCSLSCSWDVSLFRSYSSELLISTDKMYFSTSSLPPSGPPLVRNIFWNDGGTNFTVVYKVNATCGLTNVTFRVNCSGSSTIKTITSFTNTLSDLNASISVSDCWDQCSVSLSYANAAGISGWSNASVLPWPSDGVYGGFVEGSVNFTVLNTSFVNMSSLLTDGMQCLSSRQMFELVNIEWEPVECSKVNESQWRNGGSFKLLEGKEQYMSIGVNTSHGHYCIKATFTGHQRDATFTYDVNVMELPTEGSSTAAATPVATTQIASRATAGPSILIIGGAGAAGGLVLVIIAVIIGSCFCYYRKTKRQQEPHFIRNDTAEERIKLLDDEEESVTSEKTICHHLTNKRLYDVERMQRFLDSCSASQLYRNMDEIQEEPELEPNDKDLRPGNQPTSLEHHEGRRKVESPLTPAPTNQAKSSELLGGARQHKLSPSSNAGFTISALVHPPPLPPPTSLPPLSSSSPQDDNGYCRHEDFHSWKGAATLNKTTPTSSAGAGIELELLSPRPQETTPIFMPTSVSVLSNGMNLNSIPAVNDSASNSHSNLVTTGGFSNVLQPPFTPNNARTGEYVPDISFPSLASLNHSEAPPTLPRPPTNRSTETTPIPSNSSSMLSVATVEGQGGASGNESRQSRDSFLDPPSSYERKLRKDESFRRRALRESRRGGGRTRKMRQSSSFRSLSRTSTRSSSSSGILSSGGSSDSVFVSSSSTTGLHSSHEPPVLPRQSHLTLCKTSSEGFPLSTSTGYPRTRKSSGFESAPSTPKSAQSVEGQTPLDKGDLNGVASHFPFPPTNTATLGYGQQGSVANGTRFENKLKEPYPNNGDYICEVNNVQRNDGAPAMGGMGPHKLQLSSLGDTAYVSDTGQDQFNWPPPLPPMSPPHAKTDNALSPLSLSPLSLSPPLSPSSSFSGNPLLNERQASNTATNTISRRSSLTPVEELKSHASSMQDTKRKSIGAFSIQSPPQLQTLPLQSYNTKSVAPVSSSFSSSITSSQTTLTRSLFPSTATPVTTTAPSVSSVLGLPTVTSSTTQSMMHSFSNTRGSCPDSRSLLTPANSTLPQPKSLIPSPVSSFFLPASTLASKGANSHLTAAPPAMQSKSEGLSLMQQPGFASRPVASNVSAGGATNYLPAFPSVSPSNNNVMPLTLNTSDRRSSVEIGNDNSRKLSLSYIPSRSTVSTNDLTTCTLSYISSSAGSCVSTAVQSSIARAPCTATTPSYSGIPSLYAYKNGTTQPDSVKPEPCPQPHPLVPVSSNGYLMSDSGLHSKVAESGQLQSMINDALPPSLDLVVSPTLTTKDLLVKAPSTRSDSVTSEVEDDSYSIPSMTSSIQELINNNNSNGDNDDDGFESMPFSIEQFIDESPSAKENDYIL